jgi:hypothetical protein
MLKLVTWAVALMLMVAAAGAQETRQRSFAGASAVLIGLPVFTSDGREIGKITELVGEPQDPLLVAEVERPGGIGPRTMAVPIDMFVQRPDRIELTLTYEQVNDRLAGPEREP